MDENFLYSIVSFYFNVFQTTWTAHLMNPILQRTATFEGLPAWDAGACMLKTQVRSFDIWQGSDDCLIMKWKQTLEGWWFWQGWGIYEFYALSGSCAHCGEQQHYRKFFCSSCRGCWSSVWTVICMSDPASAQSHSNIASTVLCGKVLHYMYRVFFTSPRLDRRLSLI